MSREYKAFISYRHAPLDSMVAEKLHGIIEHYRCPRQFCSDAGENRKMIVFMDKKELPLSSNLSSEIREALDHSQFLIVVCSRATPESEWVRREIRYFIERHGRARVLAILAEGTPDESFPPELFEKSGNEIIEPLAADITANDSHAVLRRLSHEKHRVLAALIGCKYDQLVQRERQYLVRRYAAAACTVLFVMLAFISILVIKNNRISDQNDVLQARESELSKKNIELTNYAAKNQAQAARLRENESTLYAELAQNAYSNGDYFSAVQNAITAMTDDNGALREQYDANAEQVLNELLNSYNLDEIGLKSVIHQGTPITDFAIDAATHICIVTDVNGTARAYDLNARVCLWSVRVLSGEKNIRPHIYLCGEQAIIRNLGFLLSVQMETGKQLWTRVVEMDSENDCATLSPDGKMIAVADQTLNDQQQRMRTVRFISTEDGCDLGRIAVGSASESTFKICDFNSELGAFSEDGACFYGSYRITNSSSDASPEFHFFKIDTLTMEKTEEVTYSIEPENGYGYYDGVMHLKQIGADQIVAVLEPYEAVTVNQLNNAVNPSNQKNREGCIMPFLRIDFNAPSIAENLLAFDSVLYDESDSAHPASFATEEYMVFAISDKLIALRFTDMRFVTYSLDSNIVSIHQYENFPDFFFVFTENGKCRMGFIMSCTPRVPPAFVEFALPCEISEALQLGDGLCEIANADAVDSFSFEGNYNNECIACIPKNDPASIAFFCLKNIDASTSDSLTSEVIQPEASSKPQLSTADDAFTYIVKSRNVLTCIDKVNAKTLWQQPLSYLDDSILGMTFVNDEQAIAIANLNGTLEIFDAGSGKKLYSESLDWFVSPIVDQEDVQLLSESSSDGKKAYLYLNSGNGICIDTTQWKRTASIADMVDYDPDSRSIYCNDGRGIYHVLAECNAESLLIQAQNVCIRPAAEDPVAIVVESLQEKALLSDDTLSVTANSLEVQDNYLVLHMRVDNLTENSVPFSVYSIQIDGSETTFSVWGSAEHDFDYFPRIVLDPFERLSFDIKTDIYRNTAIIDGFHTISIYFRSKDTDDTEIRYTPARLTFDRKRNAQDILSFGNALDYMQATMCSREHTESIDSMQLIDAEIAISENVAENQTVLQVHLSQEQCAAFQSAKLYIMADVEGNGEHLCELALLRVPITLDENGLLSASFSGMLVYPHGGEYPVCQIMQEDNDQTQAKIINIKMETDNAFDPTLSCSSLSASIDLQKGSAHINQAVFSRDVSNRESFDEYKASYVGLVPDEAQPVALWETPMLYWDEFPLENGRVSFELSSIAKHNYVAVFSITNKDGSGHSIICDYDSIRQQ